MKGVERCFPTLQKKIELTKKQQEREKYVKNALKNQLMIIYQIEGIVGI